MKLFLSVVLVALGCRLLIGIATGLPISLLPLLIGTPPMKPSKLFSSTPESVDFGPREMYSFHSKTQTTYGSKLGRKPRASDILTKSLPFSGPTKGDELRDPLALLTARATSRVPLVSSEGDREVWFCRAVDDALAALFGSELDNARGV